MFDNFYLNIELLEGGYMPTRVHDGDAGLDLYSPINFEINPMQIFKLSLNFKMEFPKGYVAIMSDKSGRATKDKYEMIGGVIDSSYRGVVHVCIQSNNREVITIKKGEKVAQMIIYPCWTDIPTPVDQLSETERGSGGFGSTGLS